MANFFDQFDAQQAAPQAANFFDQFDAPKPQGFFQRLGNDYDQRVATAQRIADSGASGQRTMAETYPEMGAQLVAGPIVDAGKEVAASAGPTVTRFIQNGTNDLPGLSSYDAAMKKTVIPAVNQGAQYVAQKYGQAEQNFPRTTDALNAVGTTVGVAANVLSAMRMASEVGPTVREAASAVKDAVTPAPAIPTSDQVFGEATKAYKAADASGASLKPDATNAFIQQANKEAGQNAASLKMSGPDAVTSLLGDEDKGINSFANQPLTLQDAHAMDKDLGDAITSNLRSGNDSIANRLGKIQGALRDNLMTPDPANINGGAQGFQAWQEGNRLWSQASRLEDVEGIQKNAVGADVPSTAIKNGAKALLKKVNASGGRGWTEDQITALTEASQTGALTGVMKVLGSRLGAVTGGAVGASIGAGVGGVPGALVGNLIGNATGNAVGAPFRAGATALQSGKVKNVLRTIAQDSKYLGP